MTDALDIVRRAGLAAEDIEREKRILMAGAVLISTRNTMMRRRALAQITSEKGLRSAAAKAALAEAEAERYR